ncbi:MAG: response regulator transcription factor [Pseudomonadota bacterium]|uniref:response regulator transcription factor n=1 Tax=Pseudoalteromonas sp. XMcav1-K TaxID=3374372 RepID=UPI002EBC63AB|nr:response regulator transcription factor [Pseudomonadota bacterium]
MSKIKIILVEDDEEISRLTALYLEADGFDVSVVHDGSAATETIKKANPDLVILDLMLPGKSGIEICKEVRGCYSNPILVLTASSDDVTEVSLLKLGADDFLSKPLKPHVLVARIEALLRRSGKVYKLHHEIGAHPSIELDDNNCQIVFNGEHIQLTNAEFEMLKILKKNIGKVVSREACCQALRGINYDFSNRSIDMRISGLRKKLGDEVAPYKVIATIRNKGYKLLDEKI